MIKSLIYLLFITLSTCLSANNDPNALIGFWISEQDAKVSIAIKQNENEYIAFRLSGDAQILSKKLNSYGKSQIISHPFSIKKSASFTLPLKGSIIIPDPESKDGGTKKQDIVINLSGSLDDELLKIVTEDGQSIDFRKENFFQKSFEYLKLVASTIISFVFFFLALIFYMKVLFNRFQAISNLKVDRRHRKKLKFKDGKSLQLILFIFVLGLGIIFVIHHLLLGFLGIGSFLDHMTFWTY